MRVQFEAGALIEYQDAAQYSENNFGSGAEFVAAMRAALDSIVADPTTFQRIGQNIRIFRPKRYPYFLFCHHGDSIANGTLYAAAHHKRQQNYWRTRLPE